MHFTSFLVCLTLFVSAGFLVLKVNELSDGLADFRHVSERMKHLGNAASMMQEGFSGPIMFENQQRVKGEVLFNVLRNSRGGTQLYPDGWYDVTLTNTVPLDDTLPMHYKINNGPLKDLDNIEQMLEMISQDTLYLENVFQVFVACNLNIKVLV